MTERSDAPPRQSNLLAAIADVLDRNKYHDDTDVAHDVNVGDLRAICQAALRPTVLSEIAPPKGNAAGVWLPLSFDENRVLVDANRQPVTIKELHDAFLQLKKEFNDPPAQPCVVAPMVDADCMARIVGCSTIDEVRQVIRAFDWAVACAKQQPDKRLGERSSRNG